jgi:pimeloyl-ACP methyl ester carboxylesterase
LIQFQEISVIQEEPRMIRCVFACYLSLFCLCRGTFGQVAKDQQSPAASPGIDSEYRKFEDLLSFLRTRITQQYAIDSAKGVDEAMYVQVGGIDQWVTIRGEDRQNPALLFVHGGPGDVTNPWSFAYFAAWERRFTVVQWDQRGAGRTLQKTGLSVASTMTLDRMAQDGIELSEFLRKHLGKDRIVLIAHSFGSIVALRMVQARPDLFYAYVGTGQVADETKNWSVAYAALLEKAQATGNQQSLDELRRIGPPPYTNGEGYQVQRKWSNRFEGADRFLYGTIGLTLVAPGGSVQDLYDSRDGQNLSGERLVSLTRSSTLKDLGLEFRVPMFFFQGTEDFTCPTALAKQYLGAIKAPRKEFVPIPGGHFAVFMNSDQFLQELVARVRPLALGTELPGSSATRSVAQFQFLSIHRTLTCGSNGLESTWT